jgi:replication factor C small subunit
MTSTTEFVWAQKYRPKRIDDVVLPTHIKNTFQKFADTGDVPNLLLVGPSGIGKTTVAKALLDQIGADVMVVNGSLDRNIDMLRDRVSQFVTTVSFTQGRKFVLIDEADGLSPTVQPALRAFIEDFSHNAGFVFTANHLSRIVPALQSRCSVVEFRIEKSEAPLLAREFMTRAMRILENEGVEYEKKPLAALIQRWFPDWRRVLMELQRYSASGKIDSGILVNLDEKAIGELIGFMKRKEFSNVRRWIGENSDVSSQVLFRRFYDNSVDLFVPQFVPTLVLILARYGFQATQAVDPEINTAACLAEVMLEGSTSWKE